MAKLKKIVLVVSLEVTLERKLISNGKFFGGAIADVQEERGVSNVLFQCSLAKHLLSVYNVNVHSHAGC